MKTDYFCSHRDLWGLLLAEELLGQTGPSWRWFTVLEWLLCGSRWLMLRKSSQMRGSSGQGFLWLPSPRSLLCQRILLLRQNEWAALRPELATAQSKEKHNAKQNDRPVGAYLATRVLACCTSCKPNDSRIPRTASLLVWGKRVFSLAGPAPPQGSARHAL